MVLSGNEIRDAVRAGDLIIQPFDETPNSQGGPLGSNSYDVRLGDKLLIMGTGGKDGDGFIDMEKECGWMDVPLSSHGTFVIYPGEFYLGVTMERTGTSKFVPWIDGKSTVGRHGLAIHITAGRGDAGFDGHWTLELKNMTKFPIRLRPGQKIGQVTFFRSGPCDPEFLYAGRYNTQQAVPIPPRANNV